MAKQVAFYIDMERCTGCRTCEIACMSFRRLPVAVSWRRVRDFVAETPPSASHVALGCNHCEDPACVKACPVKAYTKRPDGVVVQNHAACIGCKACIGACPYAAPVFDAAESKASKCDYCVDLVDKGGVPRCVAACQNDALAAGPLDELQAKFGKVRAVKRLPSPAATRPSIVIRPTRATRV